MRLREVLPDHKRFKVCDRCGYIDFPGPKLVAGCLVIDQGKVLLLRRGIMPQIGKWTFPGGYVDLGETPETAAVRETAEEVRLSVQLGPLLGLFSDAEDPIAAVAVYLAEPLSGKPGLSEEATEVLYFAPHELPWDDFAFNTTKAALKTWVEETGTAKSSN
jgi:ADP-ribose pyrophosphatase YjhB (NUDIX family)